jgi:cytochrome P450
MFNIPESGFATVSHEQHRYRRGLLNNFFSKRSAGTLEGLICEKMEKAAHLLEQAHHDGSVMSIDGLTAALAADIISHYAYGQTSGILEDKSLKNDFRDAIMGIAHLRHLTRFFTIMASALDTLPP